MYLNDFSVRVLEGKEEAGGYVTISHGQQYRLSLRNAKGWTRCDAEVEIDGKSVGTWRINAHSTLVLERPANDDGRFTFYKLGSCEAQQVGLSNTESLGLIKVTFKPEAFKSHTVYYEGAPYSGGSSIRWTPDTYTLWSSNSTRDNTAIDGVGMAAMASAAMPRSVNVSYQTVSSLGTFKEAGGTGLSGKSNQHFYTVDPLEYDHAQITVINLRLVAGSDPRPLVSLSTPVPPRI